jgi:class 3 adenylate cyclase/tetratricopeptide (TPR) repeat protein
MICPQCKFDNPEEMLFCGKCGTKLEAMCPECKFTNPPQFAFCGNCGQSLTKPLEPFHREASLDEKIVKIQRYLPRGLTEKILAQRDRIEGERKRVTVMFCDMEGFTALSARLGPEQAYDIMDQVYEILIHKVHDYEGTVNEMTGDGIMALFGAPIALEDAPQRAIRSAMTIHREMARFSDTVKHAGEGMQPLKMRIGIHAGPVVVGTLGNDLRVEFKAVGDTVNMASRMEGLADPGATYVTREVFRLTEGLFRFEALGQKRVKGKEELVDVYRVIAPSTRTTRFDVSAERGLTTFIGRERELELMLDGFERSRAGRGQAFSIVSEAGVGKSRLLYEFRKAVSNEDLTFLEGRCLSYSRGVAYHSVIDVLKSNFYIQEGDTDPEIMEKIKNGLKILGTDEATTLPYFMELLSPRESGLDKIQIDPEAMRTGIIEALKRIVLKGSETRPLIMAFEDLHWMDRSSEECLKYLLESISGARVFLIFTYRPEFVHTWGAKSYHNQLNLNRLSNREVLKMVACLLGTADIDRDLEELILEKTEGVPFFIEEFIRSLIDLEMIQRKDTQCQLAEKIQDVAIPSTIQDVIMARVDSLPEGAKEVLQMGSAIEREFGYELIKRLIILPEKGLLSHMSVLKDSELLYERGIFPQSTYIFKHALTREVVYNSLLLKKRTEIHEKIGKSIENLHQDRLEEFYEMIAYQYSMSGNTRKAYEYLKLSANKATRSHSMWEALGFYSKAIERLKELPQIDENKREQIELIKMAEVPIRLLGYPEDSLTILQEGESLAEELGDTRAIAQLSNAIGLCYSSSGDPLLGARYHERCFEEAKNLNDIELMAQTARVLCLSYISSGELRKIVGIVPDVSDLLEKTHRQYEFFGTPICIYAVLQVFNGMYMGGVLGDFNTGEQLLDRVLSLAVEIDEPYTLGAMEWGCVIFYVWKGDCDNIIMHCDKCINHFEKAEATLWLGQACSAAGYGYYLSGKPQPALDYIKKGLRIQKDVGTPMWLSSHYLYRGLIHLSENNLEGAQRDVEKALELSKMNKERLFEGMSWIWLGRIMGRVGTRKATQGEKSILRGIEILKDLQLKPRYAEGYLVLGELLAEAGRIPEAREKLEKAEGMFLEMGMKYWLTKTQKVLERF